MDSSENKTEDQQIHRIPGVIPFIYTKGQKDCCYGDLPWKMVTLDDATCQLQWLDEDYIESWRNETHRKVLEALLTEDLQTLQGYVEDGSPVNKTLDEPAQEKENQQQNGPQSHKDFDVIGCTLSENHWDRTAVLQQLLFLAVFHNKIKIIKWMREQFQADMNSQDSNGTTGLLLAAWYGHEEVVRLLFKFEADPNMTDNNGITPLMAASYKGYSGIIKLLIMYQCSVDQKSHLQWTALSFGVIRGHQAAIDELMSKGSADTNMPDNEGRTPLVLATMTGNTATVQLLRSFGGDLNYCGPGGATVLMAACQVGHRHILQYLLQKGALIDMVTEKGITPLMCAVMATRLHIAAQLVKQARQNVDEMNSLGNTSLMMAVGLGDMFMVKMLLLAHANRNCSNVAGVTPMELAKLQRDEAVLKIFEEIPEDGKDGMVQIINNRKHRRLMIAAMTRNTELLKDEIEAGMQESFTDYIGRTVLMATAYWGKIDIVKMLVENGVDVNQKTSTGATALAYALQGQQEEVLSYLVQHGADTELIDASHRTLLCRSVFSRDPGILKLLINAGADIYYEDNEGKNALMLSAEQGLIDMVKILVQYGARIESKCKENMCCEDYAFIQNHIDVSDWLKQVAENRQLKRETSELVEHASNGNNGAVVELISGGADINFVDSRGNTPLILASERGHLSVVKTLLTHRAMCDFRNPLNGRTALFKSVLNGQAETVSCLLENSVNPNFADKEWHTPLMVAAQENHITISTDLLQHGAIVTKKNIRGWSALTFAINGGHLDMINLLLDHKAAIDSVDRSGTTPIGVAAFRGDIKAVKLLMDRGCDINHQDNKKWTPLMCAAQEGHCDIVICLVENNARTELTNAAGNNVFDIAFCNNHRLIVQVLMSYGLGDGYEGESASDLSIGDETDDEHEESYCDNQQQQNEMTGLTKEEAKSMDNGSQERDCSDALILPVPNLGNGDTAETEDIPSPNVIDQSTVLSEDPGNNLDTSERPSSDMEMETTRNGDNLNSVECGSVSCNDVILEDIAGATVPWNGHPEGKTNERIKDEDTKPMQKNTQPDLKEESNQNDHHSSKVEDCPRKSQSNFLLDNGSVPQQDHTGQQNFIPLDVNTPDFDSYPPLIKAIRNHNLEEVCLLIDNGADVNCADTLGRTALMFSVKTKYFVLVKFLTEHGANVNTKDVKGRSVLFHAIHNQEIVSYLISQGAVVDQQTDLGSTALTKAARFGFAHSVRYLLKAKASVSLKDKRGRNALMHCCEGNAEDSAKITDVLYCYGVDLQDVNPDGKTALEISVQAGNLVATDSLISLMNMNTARSVNLLISLYEAYPHMLVDLPQNSHTKLPVGSDITTLKYLLANEQCEVIARTLTSVCTSQAWTALFRDFTWMKSYTENRTCSSDLSDLIQVTEDQDLPDLQKELFSVLTECGCYSDLQELQEISSGTAIESVSVCIVCDKERSAHAALLEVDEEIDDIYGYEQKFCKIFEFQGLVTEVLSTLPEEEKNLYQDQIIALRMGLEEKTKVMFAKTFRNETLKKHIQSDEKVLEETTAKIDVMELEIDCLIRDKAEMEERLAVANKEIEDKEECLSVLNVVAEEDHKTCETYLKKLQDMEKQIKASDASLAEARNWTPVTGRTRQFTDQTDPPPQSSDSDLPGSTQSNHQSSVENTTSSTSIAPPTSSPSLPSNYFHQHIGNYRTVSVLTKPFSGPLPSMHLFQFHSSISQFSIDGRTDLSSACAIISMLFAYKFIKDPSTFPEYPSVWDVPDKVFDQVEEAIRQGNAEHDTNYHGMQVNLGPEEVKLMTAHLGVELVDQTDVDTREPHTLVDHVFNLKSNQVILFIKNYRVVSILPCNDNRRLLLFDSHPHTFHGYSYGSYMFYGIKNRQSIIDLFSSYETFCDPYKFYGKFAVFEVQS